MQCLPLTLTIPGVPKQLMRTGPFVAALHPADAMARGIRTIVGQPIWSRAGHSALGPSQRMLGMRCRSFGAQSPDDVARCERSTTRVGSGTDHSTSQLPEPCEQPE